MVVLLHVAAPGLYKFGEIPNSWWWICNITDSLVRSCVPLFVMLSGALILNKDYELKEFLQKRFTRVLIPFVAWTFIYLLFNHYYLGRTYTLSHVIGYFLFKPVSYHLWFVFMIISLYLATPVLRRWLKSAPDKEIIFFLLICFIGALLNPFFKKWAGNSLGFHLQFFMGYTGYYVLGYYMANRDFNLNALPATLMFITGFLGTALGTYWLTAKSGKFDAFFFEYLTPNVLLMSVGLFQLFKLQLNTKIFPSAFSSIINETSLGIYFIHVMFLVILNRKGINYSYYHPLVSIPFITISVALLSAGVIFLLQKLPKGKFITG